MSNVRCISLDVHAATIALPWRMGSCDRWGGSHIDWNQSARGCRNHECISKSSVWRVLAAKGREQPHRVLAETRLSRLNRHESGVQKAMAKAARLAGITKRVGPHVMRHYVPSLTMSSDSGSLSRCFGNSGHNADVVSDRPT